MKNVPLLVMALFLLGGCGPRRTVPVGRISPEASPFRFADKEYAKGNYLAADSAYLDFIDRNKVSADNETRNSVTVARIRRAYSAARRKDFRLARSRFIEAAKEHKGIDRPSPDYGLLADQARYQAIVCLAAEGKRDEALGEYRKFLVEHWDSPVCASVIKRVHMMLPPERWADYDKLADLAVAKQEARARRESAVCGPKALAYVLARLGKGDHDYHALAKACNTSDQGTSMEGLSKGFQSFGITPVGLLLNRKDFAAAKCPSIWLGNDHYYVLLSINESKARIWDPKTEREDSILLPPLEDKDFTAKILALENTLVSKARS